MSLPCLILFYVHYRSFKSGTPARKQARLDSNRMEVDEPEFNILKGMFFNLSFSISNNLLDILFYEKIALFLLYTIINNLLCLISIYSNLIFTLFQKFISVILIQIYVIIIIY